MPDAQQPDQLYAQPQEPVAAFRFDDKVAAVFQDMVSRSVPGYAFFLDFIGVAARRHLRAGTQCYDLGSSLGASALQMARHLTAGCHLIAVDASEAMVARCRANLQQALPHASWEVRQEDLRQTRIESASLVALNFTLQFLPDAERPDILRAIFDGMAPGGALVLADKLQFTDEAEQSLMTSLHEEFKRRQGYSELEIAQKRSALEAVLVPNTPEQHLERLAQAGFAEPRLCVQCLNFGAFLAVKP